MSEHTKTPWKVFIHRYNDPNVDWIPDIEIHETLGGKPDRVICTMDGSDEEDEARAAHIVRCVNSFDLLVEACEMLDRYHMSATDNLETIRKGGTPKCVSYDGIPEAVKAALKLAKGEAT